MISCSCAVWKCHGIRHPAGGFRIHVEGPVLGSPVSSADDRHFTSPSGENCTDRNGFMVPAAAPSVTAAPPVKTTMQAIRVQLICGFMRDPVTSGFRIGSALGTDPIGRPDCM